ncbi:hypothetical protein [Streptacidiphilus sp. EB103A]
MENENKVLEESTPEIVAEETGLIEIRILDAIETVNHKAPEG